MSPPHNSEFGTIWAMSIPGKEPWGGNSFWSWAWVCTCPVPWGGAYQGPTAEQDHEDNEGLKPVVFNNLEAGPAQCPPHLPAALRDVHVEAGEALHTGWGTGWACCHVATPPHPSPHCSPVPGPFFHIWLCVVQVGDSGPWSIAYSIYVSPLPGEDGGKRLRPAVPVPTSPRQVTQLSLVNTGLSSEARGSGAGSHPG